MFPFLVLSASVAVFGQVDFAVEVHPLLAARCASCHSGAAAQAGLRVDERAGFVRVRSKLIGKVRGTEGMRMPPSGAPLSEAEIAVLERWVADDFSWADMKVRGTSKWVAPLGHRTVVVKGDGNPIDVLLGGIVPGAGFGRRLRATGIFGFVGSRAHSRTDCRGGGNGPGRIPR